MKSGRSGAELYELVETYDGFGDHRTGTDVDAATTAWIIDLLAADLDVSARTYGFDRYEHRTRLVVDGAKVDHLPLFYEATGTAELVPAVTDVATVNNWAMPDLDTRIAEVADDRPLVAATTSPHGRLVAPNRAPTLGSGRPVVLVAGSELPALRAATSIRLEYDASIEAGRSANIVATGGTGAHVIVATPLTGWFTCAGERGTGIALAIDLARRLAETHRVTFIATSGHELHHVGARAWLDGPGAAVRPDAVVHLGASLATGPSTGDFLGQVVMTQADDETAAGIAACYADGDAAFVGTPDRWVSEAREWRDRTDALLSCTGTFDRFHTPDDRADASTSPSRLADAARRFDDAVDALLAS